MSYRTVSPSPPKNRKHYSEEINRAMHRFPLILQMLGELNREQLPYPGDDDLHHGCQRALTGILCELSRIEAAPAGKSSSAEEIAQNWLNESSANKLIDADILQRMQQFIDCILNSSKSADRSA